MKKLNKKQHDAGIGIIYLFKAMDFSMEECIEILVWLLKTNPLNTNGNRN